jgi:1-acyl-sn-glycerol-3-phosphate acyltransferase
MIRNSQPAPGTTSRLNVLRGWFNTPFFVGMFFAILCLFHVLQILVHLFSLRLQKHALDLMNLSIVLNIKYFGGATYKVVRQGIYPKDRPIIIVANHQSMYDIPMMMWELRKWELGFIAKKELGRWIPSISFALRELGSALIDRKDAKQSVEAISALGRRKEEQKQIAVIFPEGTRARDGIVKPFKSTGFKALLEAMPTAVIAPVVVRGNWELLQYQFRPVPAGVAISLTYLPVVEQNGRSPKEILGEVEGMILNEIGQSL